MPRHGRIVLALRIWGSFLSIRLRRRAQPLPQLVERLGRPGGSRRADPPARLARAVDRCLRISPLWEARCLDASLVLYGLLRRQGESAQLVIGLPEDADGHEAHAWVEIDGVDVGPPPGRGTHVRMASFG
jgi:hypothetical protein